MSRYKAYPEYKDSGVEWLGKVPSSWEITSIKRIAKIYNGATPKSGEILFWDGDVPWVTPADLGKETSPYISSGARSITKVGYDSCGTSLVPVGSIILAARAPIGTLGIAAAPMCTNQGCKSLVVNRVDSKFLFYVLSSSTVQLNLLGRGTTFLELSADELGSYKIGMPSKSSQEKIANFLDYETAKIDTLIAKQQELIKLLKEKRQAVISHAVTKGLNPNAPMRDSGVEWLGDVPQHWNLPKLKWISKTESGGTPNTSKFEEYYLDGDIPWVRTTDLNNSELFETPVRITKKAVQDSACSFLPVGSVLVAMYGGAGSIGKHALLKFESTINQAVCAILPNPVVVAEFLHMYVEFYRPFWMIGAEGTRKDPNINQDTIRELFLPLPPNSEQIAIVEFVQRRTIRIDNVIQQSESNIELMQERRTALISAAVTGKIDVRDWQPPVPEAQAA